MVMKWIFKDLLMAFDQFHIMCLCLYVLMLSGLCLFAVNFLCRVATEKKCVLHEIYMRG